MTAKQSVLDAMVDAETLRGSYPAGNGYDYFRTDCGEAGVLGRGAAKCVLQSIYPMADGWPNYTEAAVRLAREAARAAFRAVPSLRCE